MTIRQIVSATKNLNRSDEMLIHPEFYLYQSLTAWLLMSIIYACYSNISDIIPCIIKPKIIYTMRQHMLKKIPAIVFISCISASSYAYEITSNLTIENKTNTPMEMTITMPDGKPKTVKILPSATSKLDLTIGGWQLYKTYNAPFTIKSDNADQKLYAQGRVDYYVHAWPTQQYNFLDSISTAEGVSIDSTYGCFVKNSNFENKIVINGTPNNPLQAKAFSSETHCRGLKSSTFSDDHQRYTPTCTNGKTATFTLVSEEHGKLLYTAGEYDYVRVPYTLREDNAHIQKSLDDVLNNPPVPPYYLYVNVFCGSW
jgi:hypothetical protein